MTEQEIKEAKKQERERIVALIDLLRWSGTLGVSLLLKELIVNAINEQDEEYIRYLKASRPEQMGRKWSYKWMEKTANAMCPDLPCNPNGDNGDDGGESIKSSPVRPRGRYGGMRSRRSDHMGYSPSRHPMV